VRSGRDSPSTGPPVGCDGPDPVADGAADGIDVPSEEPDEQGPVGEIESQLGHSAAVNFSSISLTPSLWTMNIRHFRRT